MDSLSAVLTAALLAAVGTPILVLSVIGAVAYFVSEYKLQQVNMRLNNLEKLPPLTNRSEED